MSADRDFEAEGRDAFHDTQRRVVPRAVMVDHGHAAAAAWYRGWDSANLATNPAERPSIFGRERALMEKVAKQAHAALWKSHPATDLREDPRGFHFDVDVHVDGESTGRVARVWIELDRVEPKVIG